MFSKVKKKMKNKSYEEKVAYITRVNKFLGFNMTYEDVFGKDEKKEKADV